MAFLAGSIKDIRGILVALIAFKNASRKGEFVNLRMKHVHRSVEFDNNQMSIKLEDHKTAPSGKYAYFHMPRDVYNMLLGYCKLVRQGKEDEDSAGDQPVFGTGYEDACHSAINKWLKGAWKNSGMEYKYPDFKMTLTNNRKRMPGLARGADTTKANAMAQYMKHNKATADKHYPVHHQLGHSQPMYQWLEKVQMKKASSTRSATAPNQGRTAASPMSRRYPFFRLTPHLPRCYPPPLSRSYPLCHQGATCGPPWAVMPHLPPPRSYPPSRSYPWPSLGPHMPTLTYKHGQPWRPVCAITWAN
ncbi:uncharacterized protein LOC127880039 [Dreissena polymorpha]|uniref:Uncharacterized protein n=1 Tax=Dreissena polymorpha TaxID=45954 RepID=A0A9D4KBB0_DREPO|nr:uncharacterized protein LOC127880039 [Dreissena polymorpha]XP_052283224.1 uncharacterized protein LOC127880039 [Dreissena polymorpha]XP_052283225.1 uncharacterized protein LOC127880039 [Dreissena polymorpha]KAH3836403.1 hypothetical protein DPMN_109773 [Dreissena polymorpha]